MKEIEQVINRYLEEKDTDYAIMITGEWGCGKTYFVRHTLSDYINSTPYEKKEGNTKMFSAVYISLYGLSSIEELPYLVAKSILPFLDSKIASFIKGAAGGFANFFGIERENFKEFSKLYEIQQDKVLIFDDLERVNFKKVHIKEVLGAINQYVEGGRLKTIVISDERKIIDDDFNNFKEKTIRYTLKFQKPLSESFDDIVSELEKDDYFTFLKEQKGLIIHVFRLGDCKNLRTLKFIIDVFRVLFDKVKNLKYTSEILKDLLVSMLVYSIEYKSGMNYEDLKKLSEMSSYIGWIHKEVDKSKEPGYIDKLRGKYNEIINEYHYYPVINEYIVNGYLFEKEMETLLLELEKRFEKLEETPEGKLFKKICNWKLIEDDEFVEIIDQTIEAVKECKYSVEELSELYYLLLKLEYYRIENFKLDDEIENTFKESAKAVIQRAGFDSYIETKYYEYIPNQYSKELDDRYDSYIHFIGERNRELRIKSDQNIIDGFIEDLRKNNSNKIFDYCKGPTCQFLFENLDFKAVSEALIVANINTVEAFRRGIYYKYPDGVAAGRLSYKEIQLLYGLYNEISSFVDNQHPRKLSSVWYQLLAKKLVRILIQDGAVKETGGEYKLLREEMTSSSIVSSSTSCD